MPGSTAKLLLPYPLGTDPISDGDDQAKALAERLEVLLAATWVVPALTNGWANHAAGAPVTYRQMGGSVQLRGLGAGPIGSAVFTMPAALRPVADRYIVTVSNNALGMAIIRASDGAVIASVGSPTWFSFDFMYGL